MVWCGRSVIMVINAALYRRPRHSSSSTRYDAAVVLDSNDSPNTSHSLDAAAKETEGCGGCSSGSSRSRGGARGSVGAVVEVCTGIDVAA
jgi:hypothetical protein